MDCGALAVELIRALRKGRSRADFSRRVGYRSNVAHRWETQRSWPTAAVYLKLHRRITGAGEPFSRFFQRTPSWLDSCAPDSPEAVAAFLRQLKGHTPISALATRSGFSRYQLSRWLSGSTQPSLPVFLCLIEASSRRLLDFVALLANPEQLPSVARRWRKLELARKAAYDAPWSHAVLRALELGQQPPGVAQVPWLAGKLGVTTETVKECLTVLAASGQVMRRQRRYAPAQVMAVSTARTPELARRVKAEWTRTALARLEQGSPGNFGYSLFAISRADLHRLSILHADYVRAMQEIIARSSPTECVGLFCASLLDLAPVDNAFGEPRPSG
jgi:transcriptional regulator with XRE-family HTH domain